MALKASERVTSLVARPYRAASSQAFDPQNHGAPLARDPRLLGPRPMEVDDQGFRTEARREDRKQSVEREVGVDYIDTVSQSCGCPPVRQNPQRQWPRRLARQNVARRSGGAHAHPDCEDRRALDLQGRGQVLQVPVQASWVLMGERFTDHENGGTFRRNNLGPRLGCVPSHDPAHASQTQLRATLPWRHGSMHPTPWPDPLRSVHP